MSTWTPTNELQTTGQYWKVRPPSEDFEPIFAMEVLGEHDFDGRRRVANVYGTTLEECQAKARLVSAAPLLLQACVVAIETHDYDAGGSCPESLCWCRGMRGSIAEAS